MPVGIKSRLRESFSLRNQLLDTVLTQVFDACLERSHCIFYGEHFGHTYYGNIIRIPSAFGTDGSYFLFKRKISRLKPFCQIQ